MNPLLEEVLKQGGELSAAALAGWVTSAVNLGKKFDHAVNAAIRTLVHKFEELRENNARGWKLEIDAIKSDIDELKARVDRITTQSGEWSEESELMDLRQQVNSSIAALQRDIGRLEGKIDRSSPPPPFPPRRR